MKKVALHCLNAFRGWLIGLAEIVPGVSGGTVALIVGVYENLISGLSNFFRGLTSAVALRPAGAARSLRQINWSILIPVGIGMIGGILLGAAVIGGVLENYPTQTRAVFAGLIFGSLLIPIRLVGNSWSPLLISLAGISAVLSYTLSGIPAVNVSGESPAWIIGAAAAAACALILPGVSGAYLLMSLGLYQQTLEALRSFDVIYLSTFALGAVLGISIFSRFLQLLLKVYRAATLAIMTGLMFGGLRGLWPWRSENGEFLTVGDNYLGILTYTLAGLIVALAGILASHFFGRK